MAYMRILMRILGLSIGDSFVHEVLAAWRRPRHMVAAYVALIASSGFALVVPRLLGNTVDEVLETTRGGMFSEVVELALLILLVSAARGVCAYGQTYLSEWTGQLVAYDLRNSIFNKLAYSASAFSYHDGQQTGDQMSFRATADVEALRNFEVRRAGCCGRSTSSSWCSAPLGCSSS